VGHNAFLQRMTAVLYGGDTSADAPTRFGDDPIPLSPRDIRVLQDLTHRLASALRCNIMVFSPTGEAVLPVAMYNPLCEAIQESVGGLALCVLAASQIASPTQQDFTEYECPTGLYGLKALLRINDQPVLQILLDGFFRQRPSHAHIRRISSLTGVSTKRITKAAMQVPVLESAQLQRLGEVFIDTIKLLLGLEPLRDEPTALIASLPDELRPTAGQPFLISDAEGRILQSNDAALSALECEQEEITGKSLTELHAAPPELFEPYVVLTDPSTPLRYQARLRVGQREPKLFNVTAYAVGTPPNIIAIHLLEPVTVKKARWSLCEWSEACAYVPTPVLILREDLSVYCANQKAAEIFGYSAQELTGRLCTELCSLQSQEVLENARARLASLAPGDTLSLDLRLVREDSGVVDVKADFCALLVRDANAILCTLSPLTPLPGISAEQRVRAIKREAAQKHADAVLHLVASLAHHINNMLVGVLTQAGVLRADLPADHPIASRLESIEHNAQRIADLISSVALFAGTVPNKAGYLNLDKLIHDAVESAKEASDKDFECKVQLDPSTPPVKGHPETLSRALHNIILNAVEAIEPGHTIEITSSALQLSEEQIEDFPWAEPGLFVRITIRDDGPGIDPELLPKVTDPFVTDKPGHLGLGLAEAYGIIRAYGGILRVASIPNRGTTVGVYLPSQPVTEAQPTRLPVVLVIAQDEDLLTAVSLILEEAGYNFLTAGSLGEGLQVLAQYAHDIDIVLADERLVRNAHNQIDLSAFAEFTDQTRIVVLSSYLDQREVEQIRAQGGVGALGKPFTPETLLAGIVRFAQQGQEEQGGDTNAQ